MLLRANNITKTFTLRAGFTKHVIGKVNAVKDVSFELEEGKTLGIVGESGSGKTTLARIIAGLLTPDSGRILFEGKPLKKMDPTKIQMVFQDTLYSLDPRQKIGDILKEPLLINKYGSNKNIQDRVSELITMVGLHEQMRNKLPHQLSGGQRQRVGIARALALNPKVLVCDEPISNLDVSIGAQILNLLLDIQSKLNLSYIFIAHNLQIIEHMSDVVVVMYKGEVVEQAVTKILYRMPLHIYTKRLLNAVLNK